MKANVRRWLPSSPVDGPGNRFVVFFQGCNLNCLYCHNPETIDISNEDSSDEYELNLDELVKEIEKRQDFITGVTFSGGECTLQLEALEYLTTKIKALNLDVIVDTNGHMSKSRFQELLEFTDKLIFDMKAFDEQEHKSLTGHSNRLILSNIMEALEANKVYEIRVVVVPEIMDNERNVEKAAFMIAQSSPKTQLKLIKFRDHGVRETEVTMTSPDDDYMEVLKEIAANVGVENIVVV